MNHPRRRSSEACLDGIQCSLVVIVVILAAALEELAWMAHNIARLTNEVRWIIQEKAQIVWRRWRRAPSQDA